MKFKRHKNSKQFYFGKQVHFKHKPNVFAINDDMTQKVIETLKIGALFFGSHRGFIEIKKEKKPY